MNLESGSRLLAHNSKLITHNRTGERNEHRILVAAGLMRRLILRKHPLNVPPVAGPGQGQHQQDTRFQRGEVFARDPVR